jgi:DNA-directed RNA polymerase subunit RPC12/RpoP
MTEQDQSADYKATPEESVQLRCNRCDKPITPATAILTETGYRCAECVRSQQRAFDTTKRLDPFLGFMIAALISFAGSWLAGLLGFFTIFVAPGVGTLITNAVRLVVRRRRSKALNKAILVGAIVGALPILALAVLPLLSGSGPLLTGGGNLLPLIWRAVYAALVSSSAYAQARGLRL